MVKEYLPREPPVPPEACAMPDALLDQAACLGIVDNTFFIGLGGTYRPALKICAECPIRALCAKVGKEQPFGVWGGTTPRDRGFTQNGKRRSDYHRPG